MSANWTEEKIAALLDGAIEDDEEAAALRRVLDSDPAAKAYAERVERANALLREAFDAPAGEAIPPAIEAAIHGTSDKVAVLTPRRAPKVWVPTAIAASLALVIGLGLGALFGGTDERMIAALGDAPRDGPLHAALEELPSGAISDAGVQPMLSFWDAAGRPCREFEVMHELPEELEFGIACRKPAGDWHVEIVVTAPITEPGPEGYAPASGPASSALESMLDALGAGPALSPDQESSLLEQGWRSTQ